MYRCIELKHFLDSALKPKDLYNDWKESRAPESDGKVVKESYRSSEFAEQFVHRHSLLEDMAYSDGGLQALWKTIVFLAYTLLNQICNKINAFLIHYSNQFKWK